MAEQLDERFDQLGRLYAEYIDWQWTFNDYQRITRHSWRQIDDLSEFQANAIGCYMVMMQLEDGPVDGSIHFPIYLGHSQSCVKKRLKAATVENTNSLVRQVSLRPS